MLYYQDFLYVLEIFWIKFINKHHNNPLLSYFNIQKNENL